MLIKRRARWHLPESRATPEPVYLSRRTLISAAAAAGGIGGGLAATPAHALFGLFGGGEEAPAPAAIDDPTADLYPAARNEAFEAGRPLTEERFAATYNNFYEFGSHKRIYKAAQALPIRPWTVEFAGMVDTPRTVDIDTLIRAMPLEERVYRFRCVEAWAMTVPWTGFPMKALLDYARPLGSAKFVKMETFHRPEIASGQRQSWYPWPYVEGLTMAEAANDLAFMATGVYGKPLAPQFGTPLRLVTPWKYGFKSIKSIVRVTFTDEQPLSFWQEVAGDEYGFFANVNPDVPHKRWSQASERLLGTDEEVPTLLYNGYAEEVASLYDGVPAEKLFY